MTREEWLMTEYEIEGPFNTRREDTFLTSRNVKVNRLGLDANGVKAPTDGYHINGYSKPGFWKTVIVKKDGRFDRFWVEPMVGMGATEQVGSDRYPYTVVEVVNNRTIIVQRDNYVRTDNNGLSESQQYDYSPDRTGRRVTLTLRNNFRWVEKGQPAKYGRFGIGHRSAYQDPSY
jgi:hypothetical protein